MRRLPLLVGDALRAATGAHEWDGRDLLAK